MTEKVSVYSFGAGEVSESFFDRNDLEKYPLSVAVAENMVVDYKGGLYNRAGTKFIAMLRDEPYRMVRFKHTSDDLILLVTKARMYAGNAEGFFKASPLPLVSCSVTGGVYTGPNGVGEEDFLFWLEPVSGTSWKGYAYFDKVAGDDVFLTGDGNSIPDGNYNQFTLVSVENLSVLTDQQLREMKFVQDQLKVICTHASLAPFSFDYVSDVSWQCNVISTSMMTAPSAVDATTTTSGTGASWAYTVTAVYQDRESLPATAKVVQNVVNMTTTTGAFTITWTAPAGYTPDYYNVYRTLVQPVATFVNSGVFGYIGRAINQTMVDANITPDFTKQPPQYVDYFDNNNYPQVYARFQQRGVYAGLANDPLAVIGSVANTPDQFYTSYPAIATDSYRYVLDAQSLRPIKHLLPLRYGLLLFTADFIAQLRGTREGDAVSATNAFMENQGYTSISDMEPIAINLDVLYMTQLNSAMNAMFYTEYTNSFATQDILALSSHMFGKALLGERMVWQAEPGKIVHIVRSDGVRVTLTYDRSSEVFGWARQVTSGFYRDVVVAAYEKYELPSYLVRREINGVDVVFLEREMPRAFDAYDEEWYVDCGISNRPQPQAGVDLQLTFAGVNSAKLDQWWVRPTAGSDISWLSVGDRLYIHGSLFSVKLKRSGYFLVTNLESRAFRELFNQACGGVVGDYTQVVDYDPGEISPPLVSEVFTNAVAKLVVRNERWSYGTPVASIDGLWHLEGKKVSVLADGDAYLDLTVVNGSVSFPNPALRILVGLPYCAKVKSMPIGVQGYSLLGKPFALRGLAFRQYASRGVAVGPSFDNVQELPAFSFEPYESPLSRFSELMLHDLLGAGGWDKQVQLCFVQHYPLPFNLVGFTVNLDIGDD